MRKVLISFSFVYHVLFALPAIAAEEVSAPNFFWMSVRIFSVLACILALMLVVLYFVKKLNLQGKSFLGSQKYMEIIERLYLGPKSSVALVKVGSEFLMIGLSPNQITFLSKVTSPKEFKHGAPGVQEGAL
jgi:flagellar biosynthetic protein FliO